MPSITKNCGTGTTLAGPGTAWTNPGNAAVASANATASALTAGTSSNGLACTNYGFALPSTAVVKGIQVSFKRFASKLNCITSALVSLTKDGSTLVGNNEGSITNFWTTFATADNFGTVSDLWGTTWLATDINSANFGFIVAGSNFNASLTSDANVQGIVTVTVTYAGGGVSLTTGIIG